MFTKFAKRHLQNLFLAELGTTITSGLSMFDGQIDQWKKWTELKVPEDVYEGLWEQLPFSAAERVKIEALPEIGSETLLLTAAKANDLTLWQINSVLSQWSTHHVKSELRRISLEPTLARVMENTANSL